MNKRIAQAPLRRSMLGVTLLELMAVVMVIGILGMIALPSYRQFVMRAQRTEAKNALLRLQTNQERFYLANRTYSADPVALGFTASQSERGTYTIAVGAADANGYTATATPRAGANIDMTADAQCTSFSITAQGVRTATGTGAANCW
ncbi:MAG TPA: type IV pilin protein [Gammaproteobacteria bacterium]|nr:type IV pilin protein [Gammaproteobacteria bacterium]